MYSSQHKVEVFNFKNNIEEIMKKSDLAITRSGSSSIAEMINLHLPFIAIPLPNSLDNHQFYNAKYYSDKNCCWLIRQQDFSFESFKKLIIDIFSSSKKELNNKIFSIKQIKEINPIKNFEKEILEYLE
jgi:UDP-N-acetylglucosamine--N-acetylmuramyl-(pentapeptide) pyrophosphoryl-undecaprenol N-acetylglucosamine transferase